MNLSRRKKKELKGYKNSFYRNIHEATDRPVFTIDDAVFQLKKGVSKRNYLEQQMDEFFMQHLPRNILEIDNPQFNGTDLAGFMKQ